MKWSGYDHSQNTWHAESDFEGDDWAQAVEQWKAKGEKKKTKKAPSSWINFLTTSAQR